MIVELLELGLIKLSDNEEIKIQNENINSKLDKIILLLDK